MESRTPVVAGQFYPAQKDSCIIQIEEFLEEKIETPLPDDPIAGLVPHAGWTFSGNLAAMVFNALKQKRPDVDTFIIFGAAHSYFGQLAAVYDCGAWSTPMGDMEIDSDLAEKIADTPFAVSDLNAHAREHSIEVQLPIAQYLFEDARLVPILVPPFNHAVDLGQGIADIISVSGKRVVCVGSTDLTHYGPHYGFTPVGTDADALNWAKQVNDIEFIKFAAALDARSMLISAAEKANACGAGAAAATVAAAKTLGKKQGTLLAHITSSEVMMQKMGTSSADSVGYAAMLF